MMRRSVRRWMACGLGAGLLLQALAGAATAQTQRALPRADTGSKRAFAQMASMQQRLGQPGLVKGLDIQASWSPDGRWLLYQKTEADGRVVWMKADAETGDVSAAMDADALAVFLSKTLQREVHPNKLPIQAMGLGEGGALDLLVEGRAGERLHWTGEAHTSQWMDLAESDAFATELLPEARGRRSQGGGKSTALTIVNHTDAAIDMVWLDTNGNPHGYGAVAPGQSRTQHTYGNHAWRLVCKQSGQADKVLGDVVAADAARVVLVHGTEPVQAMQRNDRSVRRSEPRQQMPLPSLEVSEQAINVGGQSILDASAFAKAFNQAMADTATDTFAATFWQVADGHNGVDAKHAGRFDRWVDRSPDGRFALVWWVIPGDGREVTIVESSPKDQLQPKVHTFGYDKPGDRLRVRQPVLVDVLNQRIVPMDRSLFAHPWSIDRVHWSVGEPGDENGGQTRVFFVYNQRGHQVLRVLSVDAATGKTKAVVDETGDTFIDYSQKFFIKHLDGQDTLLWMSERSGFNHLYNVDRQTGEARPVTQGPFVVRSVESHDETTGRLLLKTMGRLDASGQPVGVAEGGVHWLSVGIDGSNPVWLTESDGTHTLVGTSPDKQHAVFQHERVDLPPVFELRNVQTGQLVCELACADASGLAEKMHRLPEPFVAKGRDGATDIWGVVFWPSDFDPGKSYPVLEQIYAGPHGAFVPKDFQQLRGGMQSLAELGFIVVQIDGMGTNWRSRAFHDVAYKNIQDAGFPDRVLWLKALAAKHPQVDLNRVGIYGGSAGGQNAMRAVLDHADVYKAAFADCGCHDNRMDKVWWNEAWMGFPVDESYARSSNVEDAHKLGGKLFLAVGELDRNVDPASTMQVVDALLKAGKDFELLVVPGGGHGAGGGREGRKRMIDFFVREVAGFEPGWGG